MFLSETTTFLLSWRGFLLEGRRTWHAHHRGATLGVRAGTAVAVPARQEEHLRRAGALLHQVFSRGGRVWGFGFTRTNQSTPWGALHGRWRPGVLSNYFYLRIRRSHFTRPLTRVVAHRGVPPPRRRVTLATRWTRLRRRGCLPARGYRSGGAHRLVRLASFSASFRTVARTAYQFWPWSIRSAPQEAPFRTAYHRRWWRIVGGVGRHVTTPAGRPHFEVGGLSTFSRVGLRAEFAQVVAHRHHRRRQRRRVHLRLGWVPSYPVGHLSWRTATLTRSFRRVTSAVRPRGGHRRRREWTPLVRPRWMGHPPPRWPTAVAGGGLSLLGATLLHEVNSSGVPFVHFTGLDFQPGTTPFQVHWSQTPAALGGVKFLLVNLAGAAHRRGLLRTLWWRLRCGM